MQGNTKVLLGILGAVVAGAAIGMLLAPEKGTDLRQKIKDSATGLTDRITDLVGKGRRAAEDAIGNVGNEVHNTLDKAVQKGNRMKESITS
ncbi:MAG TPA: YtxH domain-containing protein [Parasegetibacter sp.]